jgi:hypothetical protein
MIIKNNVVKIIACIMLASFANAFCSQVSPDFTAESLIRNSASFGQRVNLNGQRYKVVEVNSKYSRECIDGKVSNTISMRKITLCRPIWGYMRMEEVTVSENDNNNISEPKITTKTYFSTLAKVSAGVLAVAGLGIWMLRKK